MAASLSRRLFGSFLAVMVAALVIVGWQARLHEERLVEARQRDWAFRELALAAAALPGDALARGDRAALDAWCDRMGTATQARFTLIDSRGRLLGDTDLALDSLDLVENHATRPEVMQALATGRGWAHRHSRSVGQDLDYAAVPVGPAAGRAVLRLAIPQARLRAETRSEARLLIFTLLVVLASALGLSAAAILVLSRRLNATLEAARRMGRGELGTRAPDVPEDEIGKLGRALNQMASSLEQRLADLARERDDRERILAHMVGGVALLDERGRVLHANPGLVRLLGLSEAPPPGARFEDVVRQPALLELLDRARGGQRVLTEEVTLWSPRVRQVEATVVNLGPAGTPSSQLVVLHDLSRIRRLETVRQEFVANVSHELKTPLTLIRGCAETLLDGGLEDEPHRREFVEKIERHAERLHRIVEDLLELAKLDHPVAPAERRLLDLEATARAAVAAFESQAARKGLRLVLREGGGSCFVLGDAEMLDRALLNLLDNAVKYTEKGSVEVAVGCDGATAWCEVRDTGPGIPPEHLGRIFERFYRVERGRSRELGGTGLGLSIVKHVAEQLGGRVSASSDLGRGTVFRIELPSAEARPAGRTPPSPSSAG